MLVRLGLAAVVAIALTSFPSRSDAAMGLRCSEWINARQWVRYDPRTSQYVAVNPGNAAPVSKEVDEKSTWVIMYVSGIVETFMWLDPMLKKMADIPGLEMPPKLALPVVLDRVEELCRGGLREDRKDYRKT
jgi:hypothetical protein